MIYEYIENQFENGFSDSKKKTLICKLMQIANEIAVSLILSLPWIWVQWKEYRMIFELFSLFWSNVQMHAYNKSKCDVIIVIIRYSIHSFIFCFTHSCFIHVKCNTQFFPSVLIKIHRIDYIPHSDQSADWSFASCANSKLKITLNESLALRFFHCVMSNNQRQLIRILLNLETSKNRKSPNEITFYL